MRAFMAAVSVSSRPATPRDPKRQGNRGADGHSHGDILQRHGDSQPDAKASRELTGTMPAQG
jgi:hypothetical protein